LKKKGVGGVIIDKRGEHGLKQQRNCIEHSKKVLH
jgi:hypothetical protein